MDNQDSSIPNPSPEVRIDLSSQDMATDQACQDRCKTTREVHEEGSAQGMATDEASQGGCKITREVHEEGSAQGMATDEASQGGCKTTREIYEEGSSQGMATDEASQDGGCETPKVETEPEVNEKYRSLFEAAVKGDWKGAEDILNDDPSAITATLLTTQGAPATKKKISLSVSDIAVMAGQDQLVEILVKRFRTENKDPPIRCALYYAARRGRIRKIKELVAKAGDLDLNLALAIAIDSAPRHKEVIWYLATLTKSIPKYEIMMEIIKAGHWDIVLYLAKKHPESMTFEDIETILLISAYMKSFYRSGAQLNFWEKCIYQCIPPLVDTSFDNAKDTKMARGVVEPAIRRFKILLWNLATKLGKIIYLMLRVAPLINRIGELKLRHECWLEFANLIFKEIKMKHREDPPLILRLTQRIIVGAAFSGISEIVKLCLEQCPELMWDEQITKELIEEVVRGRHVELFRLLNSYNKIRRLMNDFGTNCDVMEAVVKWSPGRVPADVSGSAFLMQREVQWFEVLERSSSPLVPSLRYEAKKDERKDPELEQPERKTNWECFVEKREILLQEAGRWMKDTSSSCSLVATLIITVAFAAAFTVPGGNDDTGIPIFSKKTSFTMFVVADALALFSSITATLMFLAILTSRYAAKDFLHSLPRKMILGLTFLFLSLAFMLVAFGSALMIVLSERWKWIYIPIALLAAVPVILFAILQLPLYVEMVESTYRPRLYRPMKIWK